ncbi:hypothetical protein [Streptomyces sp. NPDC004270]
MTVVESRPITAGWRLYVQLGITLVVLVAAGGTLAAHRATLDSGTDRPAAVDGEWLVLACIAAAATWVCAAVARQGAVVERLPKGRLVAAHFAAGAANHLLPAGAGAAAVNLRFLTRCGLSTRRSATALAVKAASYGPQPPQPPYATGSSPPGRCCSASPRSRWPSPSSSPAGRPARWPRRWRNSPATAGR